MAYCDTETSLPPDILLFHILPRLPGKSVHRFFCVCRQWHSFLTTPAFAKMHHYHRHKLLIALFTTTPREFSTIDLEAPQDGPSASRPFPFKPPNVSLDIIESAHGLVCLRLDNKYDEREYFDIILWNPLTSEYKTVSSPYDEERYMTTTTLFTFYYSCNDYKILLVRRDHNVYIYSLKRDSWRQVETAQEDLSLLQHHLTHHYRWWHPCRPLNGKIYVEANEPDRDRATGDPIIIISFDMKTEKWRKIVGPYVGNGQVKTSLGFMVVRGRIHVHVTYRDDDGKWVVEMWRMDGDGDGDGDWTKVVYPSNRPDTFPCWYMLYPLHLTKNGNWVMYYEICPLIYEADLEMHTKKKVYACDLNIGITRCTYIETLGIHLNNY